MRLPPVGAKQLTYIPIRDLPAPQPGVARSEYSQAEKIGEQIVRLIALFAMHLMASERDRLKLFSFEVAYYRRRACATRLRRRGGSRAMTNPTPNSRARTAAAAPTPAAGPETHVAAMM